MTQDLSQDVVRIMPESKITGAFEWYSVGKSPVPVYSSYTLFLCWSNFGAYPSMKDAHNAVSTAKKQAEVTYFDSKELNANENFILMDRVHKEAIIQYANNVIDCR